MAKAKVSPDTVSFEYDGTTYTVANDTDLDLAVMEAMEEGKAVLVTKLLLGPEQYKTFTSKKRKVSELSDLQEQLFKAMSADLGESEA